MQSTNGHDIINSTTTLYKKKLKQLVASSTTQIKV